MFAGLLPRLRKVGGSLFAIFRPGSQPFYSLAGALLPMLEPDLSETDCLVETGKLAEAFTKGEVSLAQVAGRIVEKDPQVSQIQLLIDQFEELYTLCPEVRLQEAFIDELLATVEAARTQLDGSAAFLLTLRADFMGQALSHRPFADALQGWTGGTYSGRRGREAREPAPARVHPDPVVGAADGRLADAWRL
ncbi:MAG: hypothetical protein P8Z00_06190 [Anaerolineales bacterium]